MLSCTITVDREHSWSGWDWQNEVFRQTLFPGEGGEFSSEEDMANLELMQQCHAVTRDPRVLALSNRMTSNNWLVVDHADEVANFVPQLTQGQYRRKSTVTGQLTREGRRKMLSETVSMSKAAIRDRPNMNIDKAIIYRVVVVNGFPDVVHILLISEA